jgi:hypothetical protein
MCIDASVGLAETTGTSRANQVLDCSVMYRGMAGTVSTRGTSQEAAPAGKRTSTTVIEHVLSRLKDFGVSKVFGVAGDFAFPIEDAIEAFTGIEWVGCCSELNAAYAADGYGRIHGITALNTTYGWVN